MLVFKNHKNKERQSELIKLLKTDLKLTDDEIEKTKLNNSFLLYKGFLSSEIRRIYNKLEGSVNNNSLLLYSGPNTTKKHFAGPVFYSIASATNRYGCVFTGDVDCRNVDLFNIFKNYWSAVGTLQVPHHGSKNGNIHCVLEKINWRPLYCPVSTNGNYGHPHKSTMNAINELNHTSILVNINLNSVFRMVFRPNVFCFHSCFAYDRFMEKTETLSNIK